MADDVEIRELALRYQPQFALADGRLVGFEALLRWQDDSGRMVLPGDFLHSLEHRGMLAAVTRWVLAAVVTRLEAWAERLPEGARIALNLPPEALTDDLVVDELRALARQRPAVASRLTLELSERKPLEEVAAACDAFVRRVGDARIRLALDDGGAGEDPAAYLHRLPVHFLKIDTAVVARVATDEHAAAIARSEIDLAHARNVRAIAVGVEDADQHRFLAAYGCDIGQGFRYGYPEPPEQAERWLGAP